MLSPVADPGALEALEAETDKLFRIVSVHCKFLERTSKMKYEKAFVLREAWPSWIYDRVGETYTCYRSPIFTFRTFDMTGAADSWKPRHSNTVIFYGDLNDEPPPLDSWVPETL